MYDTQNKFQYIPVSIDQFQGELYTEQINIHIQILINNLNTNGN